MGKFISDDSFYGFEKSKLREDLYGKLKAKTFVETKEFEKCWKVLKLTEQDLADLQTTIINLKDTATPLGSGVNKIRFAPETYNKGKNNSIRVIYVDVMVDEYIYLISAFSKSDEANITENEEKEIRETATKLTGGLK